MNTRLPAILLALCALSTVPACGKRPVERDPISIARSNLVKNYTLSNGVMLDLTMYDCFSPVRKAKDGTSYAECRATLKGYAHSDSHFCSTVEGAGCSSTRPEE